jgi:hypothetical protein
MSLYTTKNISHPRKMTLNEKAPSAHSLNIIMQFARNSYIEQKIPIPDRLLFKS